MKKLLTILPLIFLCTSVFTQSISNQTNNMKMNPGIITTKIAESKAFYIDILGFGVTFENEFYLLLHTPDDQDQISFLLPDHPSQQPFFQKSYLGQGMYLTIEVDDVDKVYQEIKDKDITIIIDIRDEPWGDRHFAIEDPNGIGIDIVKYVSPDE